MKTVHISIRPAYPFAKHSCSVYDMVLVASMVCGPHRCLGEGVSSLFTSDSTAFSRTDSEKCPVLVFTMKEHIQEALIRIPGSDELRIRKLQVDFVVPQTSVNKEQEKKMTVSIARKREAPEKQNPS